MLMTGFETLPLHSAAGSVRGIVVVKVLSKWSNLSLMYMCEKLMHSRDKLKFHSVPVSLQQPCLAFIKVFVQESVET